MAMELNPCDASIRAAAATANTRQTLLRSGLSRLRPLDTAGATAESDSPDGMSFAMAMAANTAVDPAQSVTPAQPRRVNRYPTPRMAATPPTEAAPLA